MKDINYLTQIFGITEADKTYVVSFVGGGGKTSTMYSVADTMLEEGKSVIITTTTHIVNTRIGLGPEWQKQDFRDALIDGRFYYIPYESSETKNDDSYMEDVYSDKEHFCQEMLSYEDTMEILDIIRQSESRLLMLSKGIIGDSFHGIHPKWIDLIKKEFKGKYNAILIEADGSKCLPIKAPDVFEPALSYSTDVLVGLIGLKSFGRPCDNDNVHRIDLFSKIALCKFGEKINENHYKNLVMSKDGIFKNCPQSCKKVLILNQADLVSSLVINKISNIFSGMKDLTYVVLSAMNKKILYTNFN